MTRRYSLGMLGFLAWISTGAAEPIAGHGELRLCVTNIRQASGVLYAGLFKPGSPFPKTDGRWRHASAPVNGHAPVVLLFTDVPPGTYAIGFFQDLNGNRIHDRGFMGIPKEPFGFFLHAPVRFKEPAFEECAFTLGEGVTNVSAPMQEWGK